MHLLPESLRRAVRVAVSKVRARERAYARDGETWEGGKILRQRSRRRSYWHFASALYARKFIVLYSDRRVELRGDRETQKSCFRDADERREFCRSIFARFPAAAERRLFAGEFRKSRCRLAKRPAASIIDQQLAVPLIMILIVNKNKSLRTKRARARRIVNHRQVRRNSL